MEDIAKLGLEVDAKDVVSANKNLDEFKLKARAAELGAMALKAAMGIAVVGITAFGVGIFGAIQRLEEMDRLSRQLDRALQNTGNTARTSAREVEMWADKLEQSTGRAAEEVMAVSSNLATFGFGRETFFRAIELANDMSAAWGGDLRQNLEGLSRALDDPEKGFAMLQKRGVQLSDTQKQLVADFLDLNDKASAQRVVFEALESQVKGVAEAGFGGLEKAMAQGRKAWEDAFEDLVRGNGLAGDFRKTLIKLIDSLSSPEFINAVMGFGQIIIQMANGIVQVITGAWKALADFINWLKSQNPTNMAGGDLSSELSKQQKMLADMQKPGNGMGWFGLDAGPDDIARVTAKVKELNTELSKRTDPTKFDVSGSFDALGGATTADNPAAMFRQMSPGTMGGQDVFNPYAGQTFGSADSVGGAEKAADAYTKLIEKTIQRTDALKAEAEAMGLTQVQGQSLITLHELMAEAQATGVELTEERIDQLTRLAEAQADAQLTLDGLNLTMENRSPWEIMGENITRLSELMDRGKISADTYFAAIGKAAETAVSSYASAASGLLGQAEKLTDALGLQGREAFEAQKAISIAQAVVSGGEAIVKSYNWGTTLGGPLGGAIAAGLAAAATAAQIGAIASTTYESKSLSAPAAATPSAPAAQTADQQNSGNVANFNFAPNARVGAAEMEEILRGLRDLDRDNSTKFLLNGSAI